jgi:hypothetical protein
VYGEVSWVILLKTRQKKKMLYSPLQNQRWKNINYHSQNYVGEIKGGSQWLAKYTINFSYKLGQKWVRGVWFERPDYCYLSGSTRTKD